MNWIPILALVPLALGPLPQEDRVLTIGTCLGVEITIPLSDKDHDQEEDCHPKACHAGTCREKSPKARQSKV